MAATSSPIAPVDCLAAGVDELAQLLDELSNHVGRGDELKREESVVLEGHAEIARPPTMVRAGLCDTVQALIPVVAISIFA